MVKSSRVRLETRRTESSIKIQLKFTPLQVMAKMFYIIGPMKRSWRFCRGRWAQRWATPSWRGRYRLCCLLTPTRWSFGPSRQSSWKIVFLNLKAFGFQTTLGKFWDHLAKGIKQAIFSRIVHCFLSMYVTRASLANKNQSHRTELEVNKWICTRLGCNVMSLESENTTHSQGKYHCTADLPVWIQLLCLS